MKLYETNPMFDNVKFAEMLNNNGVKAEAVENGVLFDGNDFQAVKWANAPHWMYMNRQYMKKCL